MLTTDRRAQILEILRQNGSVTVSKLAEKFETSESTIRRDLLALSQLGKINKVHGGATVLGQEFLHNEEDFNEKSLMNINEKEEIAKYVATGEPMDKAGSYGIQGIGGLYVREIHGDYNNVVGLPIARLYHELQK